MLLPGRRPASFPMQRMRMTRTMKMTVQMRVMTTRWGPALAVGLAVEVPRRSY